jgi:pimeloyl-ACP methyl ester carboxylesterase
MRVFIHGLESSSQGNKARYFRERYPDMLIEDFQGTLSERMDLLDRILSGKEDLILVGSSFGGLMAAIYACRFPRNIKKLILLAPALDLEDFNAYQECRLDVPTTIFHGQNDDVVPLEPVRDIASRIFTHLNFHILNDDHPLSTTFETLNWSVLLSR